MNDFWTLILEKLSFTGVKDVAVWQDVVFGVITIPFAIEFLRTILNWANNKLPLNQLFAGYIKNSRVLIYLSQLTALDDNRKIDTDPKYLIAYPNPAPSLKTAISVVYRQNIDPVWSEGDGECLADVYNTLGRVGKTEGVEVANLINDWDKWSFPIITIGFNPKTEISLEKMCAPIDYEIIKNYQIKIKHFSLELDSVVPNDAAIIQKTFLKNTKVPVFILAGLGTLGTSASGYILKEKCVELAKFYGKRPFCCLIYVDASQGRGSAVIRKIYPKPSLTSIVFHPLLYFRYSKNRLFEN